MVSFPWIWTPSAVPKVAIGAIRSAGSGAADEYVVDLVTVSRVGGQSAGGSELGQPVGPER
jgi:hypothetical protein